MVCPLNAGSLAVLYPEIREPYRKVFLNILDGIEGSHQDDVVPLELKKDASPEKLGDWLKQKNITGAIALGKRSLNTILKLPDKPVTVIGAVLIQPEEAELSCISLVPSPETIIANIATFLPKIKRVIVVYQASDHWLIESAEQAAARLPLTLSTYLTTDVSDMALKYREILNSMHSTDDALWIAPGSKSLDKPLLQIILEAAWKNKLAVFSSSLIDVKRGTLFSFYANHQKMGAELVSFWQRETSKLQTSPLVLPTKSVEVAINLRTADHLYLHYSKKERQQFGLMYPTPIDK